MGTMFSLNFDFGTKLLNKSNPTKAPKKKAPAARTTNSRPTNFKQKTASRPVLKGGVGYRKYDGDALWLPNTTRPAWLDGSLPGDRGFDPLGLSNPVEYLQFDLDQLDQNQAINKGGGVVGSFKPTVDEVTTQSLQPYSEVFGLQRFRECELIHGRWAMLATLGVIVAESATGVSCVDAGKIELDGAKYLNFDLPFSISQLSIIEVLAVGGAELYRTGELDPIKRIYPGGIFDPLGLASSGVSDDEQVKRLREAEIKH